MMRRLSVLLSVVLLAGAAPPAGARVNVERRSDENPVVEVARSVMWGALGGAMVGAAIALADKDPNNEDPIRYGIVTGTFVGLGYGLWWSAHRPSGGAMLEFRDGTLRAQAIPRIELGAGPGGVTQARWRLVGVGF
jgi:uncharacterized membrane-anchored protein YitT (DUF2179 family)